MNTVPEALPTAADQPRSLEMLAPFSTLVNLEREVRAADSVEKIAFIAVNQTHRVVKYEQCILWRIDAGGTIRIQSISGISEFDRHSQAVLSIQRLLKTLSRQKNDDGPCRSVSAEDLSPDLRADWQDRLPDHAMWCPLRRRDGRVHAGLLFTRDAPFQPSEVELLAPLVDAYAHAWNALEPSGPRLRQGLLGFLCKRSVRIGALALLVAALFLPVRESVLAPGEIVPYRPLVVSAPVEGVIEAFHVSPNQSVHPGQLLFSMDDTEFSNRYQIAEKRYAVARADLQRAVQKSFSDADSKAELELYKVRAEEKRLERDYSRTLLERTRVRAERDGIAVFKDPNDWLGQPVEIGQRVLTLADPAQSEIQIWLAVEDGINLEPGSEVSLFLNTAPASPLRARIRQTSYEPEETPEGALAFKLKAEFVENERTPRIGLKGTAKIYSDDVTLFYYLMRRPLSVMRQTFGF